MHRATDANVDIELCKRQMVAIDEYLTVVNEATNGDAVNGAYIILLYKLKDRAFRCFLEELGFAEN